MLDPVWTVWLAQGIYQFIGVLSHQLFTVIITTNHYLNWITWVWFVIVNFVIYEHFYYMVFKGF